MGRGVLNFCWLLKCHSELLGMAMLGLVDIAFSALFFLRLQTNWEWINVFSISCCCCAQAKALSQSIALVPSCFQVLNWGASTVFFRHLVASLLPRNFAEARNVWLLFCGFYRQLWIFLVGRQLLVDFRCWWQGLVPQGTLSCTLCFYPSCLKMMMQQSFWLIVMPIPSFNLSTLAILTLLVAVALEPRTTGTLVTCTDR